MTRCVLIFLAILVAPPFAHSKMDNPAMSPAAKSQSGTGEPMKLRVGVRKSARPFSFSYRPLQIGDDGSGSNSVRRNVGTKSGPLQAEGFRGYIVYICDEVLKQMFINQDHEPEITFRNIDVVPIDDLIEDEENSDRVDILGSEVDILCDPAIVTRERVARYAVSPPLFLTGVSYLVRKDTVPPLSACSGGALIGVVGSADTYIEGLEAILEVGEWRKYRRDIVRALRGEDSDDRQCPGSENRVIWRGKSHSDVARAFCEGKVYYYVGDFEVISENANEYPGCEWVRSAQSFTDDRYAVFAYIDYQETTKALWIGRFFEVLNREIATEDSLLDRAYKATFGTAPQSKKLELFFWNMRGQD